MRYFIRSWFFWFESNWTSIHHIFDPQRRGQKWLFWLIVEVICAIVGIPLGILLVSILGGWAWLVVLFLHLLYAHMEYQQDLGSLAPALALLIGHFAWAISTTMGIILAWPWLVLGVQWFLSSN